jgi:prepilin-type processing-associated H-X9-DG protein
MRFWQVCVTFHHTFGMASGMLSNRMDMNIQGCRGSKGFTFPEALMVIGIITILALLFVPYSPRTPGRSNRISCVNNLKQVGFAYRTWALDHNEKYPGQVLVTNGGAMERLIAGDAYFAFMVMSNELSTPNILFCPADEYPRRKKAAVFSPASGAGLVFQGNTNTSYFAAVDAGPTNENAFLSGDRNIAVNNVPLGSGLRSLAANDSLSWMNTMHNKQGNVGLADGSVQQLSRLRLIERLSNTGFATNRLVFP